MTKARAFHGVLGLPAARRRQRIGWNLAGHQAVTHAVELKALPASHSFALPEA